MVINNALENRKWIKKPWIPVSPLLSAAEEILLVQSTMGLTKSNCHLYFLFMIKLLREFIGFLTLSFGLVFLNCSVVDRIFMISFMHGIEDCISLFKGQKWLKGKPDHEHRLGTVLECKRPPREINDVQSMSLHLCGDFKLQILLFKNCLTSSLFNVVQCSWSTC